MPKAVRLRDAGLSGDSIASRLDVPTEAMTLLLRLAEAKVANLMVAHEPASPEYDITAHPEDVIKTAMGSALSAALQRPQKRKPL
jgi:orotate phosphoribosyltransferase-like protein